MVRFPPLLSQCRRIGRSEDNALLLIDARADRGAYGRSQRRMLAVAELSCVSPASMRETAGVGVAAWLVSCVTETVVTFSWGGRRSVSEGIRSRSSAAG